jgi:hypothetical protein
MEDSAVNPGVFIVISRFWSVGKTTPALSLVTDRRTERLTLTQAGRLQPYWQGKAVLFLFALPLARKAKGVQGASYLRRDTRAVPKRSTSSLIMAVVLEGEFGIKSGHIHKVHPSCWPWVM